MTSRTNEQIAEILKDDSRSKEDRISELLTMRQDARALQRAGTESPMVNEDQTSSQLREIDLALEKLGHDELQEADEKNAATL